MPLVCFTLVRNCTAQKRNFLAKTSRYSFTLVRNCTAQKHISSSICHIISFTLVRNCTAQKPPLCRLLIEHMFYSSKKLYSTKTSSSTLPTNFKSFTLVRNCTAQKPHFQEKRYFFLIFKLKINYKKVFSLKNLFLFCKNALLLPFSLLQKCILVHLHRQADFWDFQNNV